MDSNTIRAWLAVIDSLSYYELLGVPPQAGADQVRKAFYRFAESFHPDGHAMRPENERRSINTVFKRGAEAYRVLSDGQLRQRYDEARPAGNAAARAAMMAPRPTGPQAMRAPPPSLSAPSLSSPPDSAPGSKRPAAVTITGKLEDYVRQARARPFAQKAEELAKKKDYAKAKLQLKLAMNMDQGNPTLENYLKELDEQIALQKSKPYTPGG
jgi:curved DNA-binding protein CbpA